LPYWLARTQSGVDWKNTDSENMSCGLQWRKKMNLRKGFKESRETNGMVRHACEGHGRDELDRSGGKAKTR
jgi:hypothetical protein